MAANFEDFDVDEEDVHGEIDGECIDSPFEYDSPYDSGEEEPESDEEDIYFPNIPAEQVEGLEDENEYGAAPYMFQPRLPEGAQPRRPVVDAEDGENRQRLQILDWCQCGNCTLMETVVESVCCREIPCIVEKMAETETPEDCITAHEFFESVTLCRHVLQVAYLGYSNRARRRIPHAEHERYRYTAYCQMVRWNWGILGRRNRVPVPSCAVMKIVERYPPPRGQQRTGFKYPPPIEL